MAALQDTGIRKTRKTRIEIHFCFEDELHSITEKFMEYQAHHGNEVAEE